MTLDSSPQGFEHAVRTLFELGGYDVVGEHILAHKKIDLYVEERRLGSVRRIAIECKDHGRPISQHLLTQIYSNYRPLYDANLIDEILLVTSHGITPSAETMCRTTRELRHLTYQDLESVIIDFTSYLGGLIEEYEADGLISRLCAASYPARYRPRTGGARLDFWARRYPDCDTGELWDGKDDLSKASIVASCPESIAGQGGPHSHNGSAWRNFFGTVAKRPAWKDLYDQKNRPQLQLRSLHASKSAGALRYLAGWF